jgi:hypothetical protein
LLFLSEKAIHTNACTYIAKVGRCSNSDENVHHLSAKLLRNAKKLLFLLYFVSFGFINIYDFVVSKG